MSAGDDMPLLDMFREEIQFQCQNFRVALADRDAAALLLAAHSARGAAKICDIGAAATLAKELEELAGAIAHDKATFDPGTTAAMNEANELLALLENPACDPAVWTSDHGERRKQLEEILRGITG